MKMKRPILFTNKADCCGCGACEQSCPREAITMIADSEGFLYPEISANKCINCNLCKDVCPIKAICL